MSENKDTYYEFKELPVLVTKGLVVFPTTEQSLYVERTISVNAYNDSLSEFNGYCIITSQKDLTIDNLKGSLDEIYEIGTLCKVSKDPINNLPIKIRIQAIERVKILNIYDKNSAYYVNFEILEDQKEDDERVPKIVLKEFANVAKKALRSQLLRYASSQFINKVSESEDPKSACYLIADTLNIDTSKKNEILAKDKISDKLFLMIEIINESLVAEELEKQITEKVRETTEKNQREYILREKMKVIQHELGDDANSYDEKIEKEFEEHEYPKETKEKIESELNRLKKMPQGSLEGSLIQDYIDTLLDVPWYKETEDNDDINNVIKVLDEDHYGLKKVKERIIEYLAVKKVNGNLKAPILCFYGPPGCGKTSLSRSIARALGRKFVKCSLGGISDEAEIRGHRRTYVGSRPGRIISLLRKAGVKNPVFLLDEVDKLGRDGFKGDPSSALLEVLDPEQNYSFSDNYLEVPYDLSNVLFICTANDLSTIPEPLLDRLELIEVESYTVIDKLHIAKDFLIKIECKNNGLKDDDITFTDDAIMYICERYTRESGVRSLQRNIASICRKVVVDKLKSSEKDKFVIDIDAVKKYLGTEVFESTEKEKGEQVGVVTGLAWTPFGGDILPIEVNYFPGKGQLILTGKLGDVMKESCNIAFDYIKANANKYNINSEIFEKNDIHIHVPEGAVSKDGPSAGCAITTAMVSAFTKKPVSGDIAMTGEVTLRGLALPIGGLREKTLAALRSGIKTVIVPKENKKSIDELPDEIKNNLNIIFMSNVDDAINVCLK